MPVRRMGIREAAFAPSETLPVHRSVGRICAQVTAACPPAVPVAVSGEEITYEVAEVMRYYGMDTVRVILHTGF